MDRIEGGTMGFKLKGIVRFIVKNTVHVELTTMQKAYSE